MDKKPKMNASDRIEICLKHNSQENMAQLGQEFTPLPVNCDQGTQLYTYGRCLCNLGWQRRKSPERGAE
jgi:hypothetical protein